MSITNGVKCPKDLELQVIEGVQSGMSYREVAEQYQLATKTVGNIMHRMDEMSTDFTQKMCKNTGKAAMRFSLIAFDQLTHRLLKGEGIQPAQLAVMAGIAASRGNELLSKPEEIAPPDWSKIGNSVAKELGIDTPLTEVLDSQTIQAD